MWPVPADVEFFDAEREIDRVDIFQRSRQGADVREQKREPEQCDEDTEARAHNKAEGLLPLFRRVHWP